MAIDHAPYLDFIEYRCALACQNLKNPSKDVQKYDIVPATEEQKNLVFGVARSTNSLFTKGINNIRFKLFHDRRTDQFFFAFDGTKTLYDGIDDVRQWFGKETKIYQQAREIAGHVRPEFRDKILFTGHSLGGGLAIVASLVCGAQAIVFNSARLHSNTLSGLTADDSRIDLYSVRGDIVSMKIPLPGHINVGRETKMTTLPFEALHSLGQVLAGLRRTFSFSIFLINSVVEILQPRVGLNTEQLHRAVSGIVRRELVKPNMLPDLLKIDYRVEQVDPSNDKVIVSVMYRKDKISADLIECESDWKWEDLPEEFREDFIRSRENSLHYSVYKQVPAAGLENKR